MLDAARLPSSVDGIYFLTTCFCGHSMRIAPELKNLKEKIKNALKSSSVNAILDVLEELSHMRTKHVENLLSEMHDKSGELGIDLIAAVFPYPVSKYVGQDPKILNRYLKEVHVMLYHKCSGAACLNAEIKGLIKTLRGLGLKEGEIKEISEKIFGIEIKGDVNALDEGIEIHRLDKIIALSEKVYKDKFVPILWLDERMVSRIDQYINNFRDLDLFVH